MINVASLVEIPTKEINCLSNLDEFMTRIVVYASIVIDFCLFVSVASRRPDQCGVKLLLDHGRRFWLMQQEWWIPTNVRHHQVYQVSAGSDEAVGRRWQSCWVQCHWRQSSEGCSVVPYSNGGWSTGPSGARKFRVCQGGRANVFTILCWTITFILNVFWRVARLGRRWMSREMYSRQRQWGYVQMVRLSCCCTELDRSQEVILPRLLT